AGISRIPIDGPRILKEGPKKRTEELPRTSRDSRDSIATREMVATRENVATRESNRDEKELFARRAATREPISRLASMRPCEKAGCTWEMFKDLVCEKYYPTYYRAEMERQFLSLQQGTRTVDEYEREFTRLAAFVPDLVRTEAQRAQRFIDGLYQAVRHNIVGHGTQMYARAVSIAQEVDASIRREAVRDQFQPSALAQSSSVPPLPALPSTQPPKNNKRKGKGALADKRTRRRLQQIPQCPTCGRLHRGECRFGQDVCYYCHEPGHFANRCPKKAQQPQQPPQQQQQP
ncbi:Unknown protein, partial [Striga hermonthica]